MGVTNYKKTFLTIEYNQSKQFEDALAYIFQKYCSVPSDPPTAQTDDRSPPHKVTHLLGSRPPKGAVISDVALDKFAYETNGAPFPSESKAELKQFLECDDQGRLTVSGSCGGRQMDCTNSCTPR